MPGGERTVDHQLRAAAAERGDQPFLTIVDTGAAWTFAELEAATARVANGLLAHGYRPGEHLATLLGNGAPFVLTWLGACRAGLTLVPVNAGLKGEGLRHVVDHSDAVGIVVADDLAPELAAVRGDLPRLREVLVTDGRTLPFDGDPGAVDVATAGTDPMMLMYTSGTTGLPKAIVIDHERIMSGRLVLELAGIGADDVAYTSLPLFHANAALISFWGALELGIPLHLGRRFSASRHWAEVTAAGATTFNALGAMLPILCKQDPRPDDAGNPCRIVLSAACPKEIWRPFEARFGVRIVECYGTAEGGGTMAGPEAPVGSIGKPVPGNEIRIVREDGTNCATGEVGELLVRPAGGVARVRYYKDEAASARKTDGGWLRTGDRVREDAEGWLWFVDRGDHFMRRRGENISSTEVEAVVAQHPDVLEAAAYPIPSELGEDDVAVAVVPRPGAAIEPAELIEFCRERMASFQVPRYVRCLDELPKTETHRAQKVALARAGRTPDTWDRDGSAG